VPQLNWREYLQITLGDVDLNDNEEVVSYAMPYLVQMGKILHETDRRIIHNYIIWRLVMYSIQFVFMLEINVSFTHTLMPRR
jgi:membrane metallo-endopeptidase-like protein 1